MKQTYIISLLVISLLTGTINAQNNWNLAANWGGTNYERSEAVGTDNNGNMYMTGVFQSATLTMGATTLTNYGSQDIFIAKTDAAGNVLWAVQSTGGTGLDYSADIVVASNDRLFVTGYFTSASVTFNGTNGVSIPVVNSSPGFEDGFIAAYDNNGGLIWVQRITGANSDRGWRITADANAVYVTGQATSNPVYFAGNAVATNGLSADIFQVKFTWAGVYLWGKTYGGSAHDSGNDIVTDGQRVYAVSHFHSSSITMGPTFNNSGGNFADIIVSATDPATGNILWAVQGTGTATGTEHFYALATDGNGNLYAHGETQGAQLTFNPAVTMNNGSAPYSSVITVKFRGTDGTAVWGDISTGTNFDFGRDIVADGCNNIYVTGHFSSSSITFGGSTLNATTSTLNTYVVRYTANGGVAGAYHPAGTGSTGSEGHGLALDKSSGDLVLCGRINNTVTFGALPPLVSAGNSDILLARSDESGNTWVMTTMNSNKRDNGNDILTDGLGNVYIAGTFEQATTFPSSVSNVTVTDATNTSSAYIAKYDACGNLLWVNFEDISGSCEGVGIHMDKISSSIYMTGPSSGDIRFQSVAATPGGPAPVGGASITANGYYVAQFDKATGACTEIWSPNNANFKTTSITGKFIFWPSSTSNLYVCGSFNTGSATVPFVTRINDPGTMTVPSGWPVTGINAVNGTVSFAYDIVLNASENRVYITGEFRNSLEFTGTGTVSTSAIRDGFIAAITTTGVPVAGYLRKAGAATGEEAVGTGLALDNTSRMCYTGFYTGAILNFYGYGVWSLSNPGIRREYTICISNNVYVWHTNIYDTGNTGNVVGTGITFSDGNFYVAGRFNAGTLNFPANNVHSPNTGLNRTFIAQISSTGILNWGNVTTNGGDPLSEHSATRIDASSDYVYSTGSYLRKLGYAFGNPPSGVITSSTLGGGFSFNTYILRNAIYNGGSFRLQADKGNEPQTAEIAHETIAVYPNPARDEVNIRLVAGSDESVLEITLMDVQGRVVQRMSVAGASARLDIGELESGMYIVQVSTEGKLYTEKLLVQ